MNRQDYWKEKGYTAENIECHLNFERRKGKESRDRRIKNNLKNKDIIKKIKEELVGKTFKTTGGREITILKISPSVDGVGFWYKTLTIFSDGSKGNYRYFYWFDEYNKKEFIKTL